MTWTYSNTLATTKDQVRFLIQDTDTTDQQLQDEEINWILTQELDAFDAGAIAADRLAFKYARKADRQVGDVRVASSVIARQYQTLAKDLRAQALALTAIIPYLGGTSIADKLIDETDTDRNKPFFTRKLHDAPLGAPLGGSTGSLGPSQSSAT